MPDWSDPAEIVRDAEAFNKLIFALVGMYFWELLVTSRFDWEVVSRKRPFRLPLGTCNLLSQLLLTAPTVFYFLTRYALFWALVGLMVTVNVASEINCQALYTFCQWAGNTAIAGASTCLMLRTIAIWKRKMFIVGPLVMRSLGQWALLYYAIVSVKAVWVEAQGVCSVTGASSLVLNVIYIYTMVFDLIVLVVSTIGLLSLDTHSGIWNLLFRDGILFFAVAFSANAVPAVLNVLNLNPAMNIIAAVPAAAVSAIAATRAVVRLMTSSQKEAIKTFDSGGISSRAVRATLAKYSGGASVAVSASSPMMNNGLRSHATSQLDLETEEIELERKVRRFPSGSTGHNVRINEDDLDFDLEPGMPYDGSPQTRRPSVRRPPPPSLPVGCAI